MKFRRFFLPAALGVSLLIPALIPTRAFARPEVGLDVGLFAPFSSKTRDRFGSSFVSVGPGLGSVVPRAGGKLRPDFELIQQERNDNRVFLLIGGVQYRRTFDPQPEPKQRFVPYYGAGLDLMYGRVRVPDENRHGSSIGGGASVFLGTSIGKRTYVEARVRGLSSVESYNFSGLSLSAGVRF